MSISGYGASVEYDGATVRIIGGKVQAKIWRTGSVTIPVEDITEMDYRPASPLVNGALSFKTARPANDYATPRDDDTFTTVPSSGLVVHWRRKDQAAFAALHEQLSRQD